MKQPMGPAALATLGDLDRPPRPVRDRRYLELLLPAGDGAARCLRLATRRRPRCSLCERMAETANRVGWGRPEKCWPPEGPTPPSPEYLSGFREMVAGPSGPPAGLPCRKPAGEHTEFISGAGPGRQLIAGRSPPTDPPVSRHARGRETLWDFLPPGAACASGRLSDVDHGGRSACAAAGFR